MRQQLFLPVSCLHEPGVLLDDREPAFDDVQARAVILLDLVELPEQCGMLRQNLAVALLRRGDLRHGVCDLAKQGSKALLLRLEAILLFLKLVLLVADLAKQLQRQVFRFVSHARSCLPLCCSTSERCSLGSRLRPPRKNPRPSGQGRRHARAILLFATVASAAIPSSESPIASNFGRRSAPTPSLRAIRIGS